jgi:transposase
LPVLVWDGAGAHRGKQLAAVATTRVFLPPYSPELNPVERVFEEVRRHVEGVAYADIAAKRAAVERYLTRFAADPARVKRWCGWDWLTDALTRLPAAELPPSSHRFGITR